MTSPIQLLCLLPFNYYGRVCAAPRAVKKPKGSQEAHEPIRPALAQAAEAAGALFRTKVDDLVPEIQDVNF